MINDEQVTEDLVNDKANSSFDTEVFEGAFKDDITEWNINVIEMNKESLFGFIWNVFKSEGFVDEFEFNIPYWWNFIEELYVWYSYKKNPFHNFNHGVNGKT